jgi:hypothetical protein
VSCLDAARFGPVDGLTFVGGADVVAIHDRDVVRGGPASFRRLLGSARGAPFTTVGEVGERLRGARR